MSTPPEQRAGVADVDLTGTTVLITGSTSGIGRETALALGRLGGRVLVHGRDRERGRDALSALESTGADADLFLADLAVQSNVRDLAGEVAAAVDSLDVLLNNAGGYFREATTTPDGIEYTIAVNHLAPFLLTHHLLPEMPERGRVVTTSSAAHRNGSLDVDRLDEAGDSGWQAYSRSKLANVLFTRELARRTDRATATCFHPGFVPGSALFREAPLPIRVPVQLARFVPGVGTSVEAGAATAVYLAASPAVGDLSGEYFTGQSPGQPSRVARDPELARRLWERSEELTDLDGDLRLSEPGGG